MVITLPIHPLVGRSVEMLRRVRGPDGRLYVDVLHPDGHTLRVLIDWTDLANMSCETASSARATARALGDLVTTVEMISRSFLDESTLSGAHSDTEHTISDLDASSSRQQSPATLDDRAAGGGVGGAGSSGTDTGRGDP